MAALSLSLSPDIFLSVLGWVNEEAAMPVPQQPYQPWGQEQPLSWPPYGLYIVTVLLLCVFLSVCLCVSMSVCDTGRALVHRRQIVHVLRPQWDPHHERCHGS